jgi:hypothetical protein
VTRSAYGTIAIPVAVIRNGAGPTVLPDGRQPWRRVRGPDRAREADPLRSNPSTSRGRVIVLPAANFPAAMAGERVSPIDGGNLNRAFISDPDRGPTWAIAHYIDTVLYSWRTTTTTCTRAARRWNTCRSARSACRATPSSTRNRAPRSRPSTRRCRWCGPTPPTNRLAASGALRRKVVALGGEFGGSGRVSISGVKTVERGIRNLLAHAGVLVGAKVEKGQPTRIVELRGATTTSTRRRPGFSSRSARIGDAVEKGQPCGRSISSTTPRASRSSAISGPRAAGVQAPPGPCRARRLRRHLATDISS